MACRGAFVSTNSSELTSYCRRPVRPQRRSAVKRLRSIGYKTGFGLGASVTSLRSGPRAMPAAHPGSGWGKEVPSLDAVGPS